MKTITVPGNPEHLSTLVVPMSEEFHDHEVVRIESADGSKSVEKRIFRVVDGGENQWELQFE
ncbi:hypothetical protein MUY27_07885 [Mucilaginibacter sp. RS28]|uniref:Uncharacterized protein n=1 Tax=Mucilaginibacter straminoryzae TaxID=2932774 RepID=A0A9X2B8M8_9SPHI|nr:hypothetical protein [Mucilaginibacter straminoryzae]MCJ8209626.1 hypothetical protein [Mucilaginibacter straminoryzae]